MYHACVCYSAKPVMEIASQLSIVEAPARAVVSFNKEKKKIVQTNMTLFVLNDAEYQRLQNGGFFKREKKAIEFTDYTIRENRTPTGNQTSNLFIRFDRKHEFSADEIEQILDTWLCPLQARGVIGSFTVSIPNGDREDSTRHNGFGFISFNEATSLNDRCIVFAMLQNRRLETSKPNSLLNVAWKKSDVGMEKRV